MTVPDPILAPAGHTECLLGNEAIARGALEAGVGFVSGYPGTPSSEVTDTLGRVARERGIVFELSVNEKIALEMAFAASLAGARSLCAMKHLGLSYAGDPLSTIPYIGVRAGLVIVSAGDPSCHTSPNEQDQRHLGPMLHLPVLDPPSPAEALEITRFAFELSEDSRLPVLLRPTTRVCHTRTAVRFGPLAPHRAPTGFERDPAALSPMPVNARRMRLEIDDRLAVARRRIAKSGLLRRSGSGPFGIVASGAMASMCSDLLAARGNDGSVALVTLAAVHPLPEELLLELFEDLDRILVVEELSPFIEDALRAILRSCRPGLEIFGKRTGHLPGPFELGAEPIGAALDRLASRGVQKSSRATRWQGGGGPATEEYSWYFAGSGGTHNAAIVARSRLMDTSSSHTPPKPRATLPDLKPEALSTQLPVRPPILCAGCPHRSAFFAARAAFGADALFFNDIGCYSLGYGPPLECADAILCMGAGLTLAAGVSRVTGERTVGFVGDSTFFHSGMPALLNVVKEDVSMVAVILDNHVTAMTGFQESPGARFEDGRAVRDVSIEAVVRALGVRHVEKIDPHELGSAIAAFRRAQGARGPSVVIVERPCPVHLGREVGPEERRPYEVDPDRCQRCGRASFGFRCDVPVTRGFERNMARTRALESTPWAVRPAVAPCSAACPLSLCVQGYAGHIAAGELPEALRHITLHLPLPEAVCRVCHRPCETACVRVTVDEPLAINDLKRFVVDWAAKNGVAHELQADPPSGNRVAVVGAGPAGLAAAHDLTLRGHDVTLLDAEPEPGGLLRTGIPRYRLPREALARDIGRLLGMGVHFRGGAVLGRDIRLRALLDEGMGAVVVAVGAGVPRKLGIPGEAGEGSPFVEDALGYLRQVNCDPWESPTILESPRRPLEVPDGGRPLEVPDGGRPLEVPDGVRGTGGGSAAFTGRRVVVIGGGNAAIDSARTALRAGAEKVAIACLEPLHAMPALPDELEAGEREGVRIEPELQPLRIDREAGTLVCRRIGSDGGEVSFEVDHVLVAIGQTPGEFLAADDLPIERLGDGTLRVDPETGRTSHLRVFAAGDVAPGDRTVTAAIAQGQRVAWAVDRVLRGAAHADRRPPPPRPIVARPVRGPWSARTDTAARQRPYVLAATAPAGNDEVHGSFTAEQARAEAERCMSCGMCGNCRSCVEVFGCPALEAVQGAPMRIDGDACIGCGACAILCPDGAIRPAEARS